MYIKNLATGVIQECHNADVIAMCEKNSKEYEVSENPITDAGNDPDAEAKVAEDAEKEKEEQKAAKKAEEDEKLAAEAKAAEDKAAEDKANAAANNPDGATKVDDYESMKVEDLRKVAKDKGVQGYANMNKETLIEVIRAHE